MRTAPAWGNRARVRLIIGCLGRICDLQRIREGQAADHRRMVEIVIERVIGAGFDAQNELGRLRAVKLLIRDQNIIRGPPARREIDAADHIVTVNITEGVLATPSLGHRGECAARARINPQEWDGPASRGGNLHRFVVGRAECVPHGPSAREQVRVRVVGCCRGIQQRVGGVEWQLADDRRRIKIIVGWTRAGRGSHV